MAVTAPPRFFVAPDTLQGVTARATAAIAMDRGAHGFDPALPEMGGIFLALGRAVPKGAHLPPAHAIDVAATVARLLAIEPPRSSEGAPIAGIGADLPRTSAPAQAAHGEAR